MPLEAGTLIPDLDANNPLGSDPKSEGDDHLRLIKRTVLGSFPAFVGTTAVPKTVALTEDQINDAALKSEAATISGAWEHTVPLLLANDIPLQARFSSGPATDIVKMSSVDRLTFGSAGHHTDFFAATGANAFRYFVGGAEVSRGGTLADGGLLVGDQLGFFKKAGFRNPSGLSVPDGDYTILQNNEGQVLRRGHSNTDWICPVLEANTCITLINSSVTGTRIVASGTTLEWYSGDGAQDTGTRNMAGGSVVQLRYRTASVVEIWGNGIS